MRRVPSPQRIFRQQKKCDARSLSERFIFFGGSIVVCDRVCRPGVCGCLSNHNRGSETLRVIYAIPFR
jgi:hypothetical protein